MGGLITLPHLFAGYLEILGALKVCPGLYMQSFIHLPTSGQRGIKMSLYREQFRTKLLEKVLTGFVVTFI